MSHRRVKPIALAAAAAIVLAAGVAYAAPITVALYQFEQAGDAASFVKVSGGKCKKKQTGGGKMAITVGPGTNRCVFRTSVLADSSDKGPDQELAATVSVGKQTPAKLQKKAYVSVAVRAGDTSGYELRVFPGGAKWQLWRDPAGAGVADILSSGSGKFIKAGVKPNVISLRAFDFGAVSPQLVAKVNGRAVYTATDTAANTPDGKRTQVAVGAKGTGPGAGIAGVLDDIAVRVPNPL